MNTKSTNIAPADLPTGITVADITAPVCGYIGGRFRKAKKSDELETTLGSYGKLRLVKTSGLGWCIATLDIVASKGRTYGVQVANGRACRFGNGPHVLLDLTLYLRKSRMKALQPFVELYNKGLVAGNEIRDRISTRRAIGQQMRAEGRRSWLW